VRVGILGNGVSGLSCAVRLLEAGHDVLLTARDEPGRTTSAVAGAIWFPYSVQPAERAGPWGAATYAELARLADAGAPVTMVDFTMLYPERLAEEPWWISALPAGASVPASELPPGYGDGRDVRVPLVEAPAYLAWLVDRVTALGGRFERRGVGRLEDVGGDVVVNCAGVGAGDEVVPVRGQVVYVTTDAPIKPMCDEHGPNALAYILPRADAIVLGGTAEEGDLEPLPREATTRSIIERTTRLQPALAGARYVGAAVGFRPGRSAVRLERGELEDGRPVVHDYGHGGSGFTLSWGCADEVAALVQERCQTPFLR
jgi:D-amino-acid oxidase